MKHALALLAALAFLAGGTLRATGGEKDRVIEMEQHMWDAYKKKDATALREIMADEFLEVVGSGHRFTKEQVLKVVSDITVDEFTMEDVKAITIGSDSVLLSYKLEIKGAFKGNPFGSNPRMSTSVWTLRHGKWQIVLSQETAIKQ